MVCVFGVLLSGAMSAQAITVPITAEFKPDPTRPNANDFKNTTPVTGICGHYAYRGLCQSRGLFSINTPIQFNSTGPIEANHSNPRSGAMLQVRSGWRELEITPVGGGNSETVSFRISGISSTYLTSQGVVSLVGGGVSQSEAHRMLWEGGNWDLAPRPCLETGVRAAIWPAQFLFFWLTPVDGLCAKTALFTIPALRFYDLDFVYELRTPRPLEMAAGTYTGRLALTVGPGADIDMGDVMLPDDNIIELDFNLTVDHILKVEVPPGGNRVQLEPQGGWQAWLNNGRKPTRLFRDQTVNLWASSQFKMTLECPEPIGNTCSVRNAAGHQVPLDVAVSLPLGISDGAGRSVERRPLRLDGSGTELFQPTRFIDRKPSTLHFEIKAEGVLQMLDQPNAGSYSGSATVVWDSEV
ncbi:hypothetical protein HX791_06910 [Pseudomonas costantinii]|nr:hypothetical protein [Pseudomonas costantinii]